MMLKMVGIYDICCMCTVAMLFMLLCTVAMFFTHMHAHTQGANQHTQGANHKVELHVVTEANALEHIGAASQVMSHAYARIHTRRES